MTVNRRVGGTGGAAPFDFPIGASWRRLKMTDSSSPIPFDCIYHPQPFLEARLVTITFGCLLAAFSIISNLILLLTLFTSCSYVRNQYQFHSVIAVIDIIFAILFFMNSAIVFAEYFEILSLFESWHKYARSCVTGGQISSTSSTFIVVALATEHFLPIFNSCKRLTQLMRQHRCLCILIAIGLSVLIKGTIFWEIVIISAPACKGFARYYLTNSELAFHPVYNAVWRVWIRNLVTVICPFIVLLTCVLSTIFCNQLLTPVAAIECITEQKMRTKETARIVVLIVSCLLANISNVTIAVFELASTSKPHFRQGRFYVLGVDSGTVLAILVGALRPLIYAFDDRRFHYHLRAFLRSPGFRLRHHMLNGRQRPWTVRTTFEQNRFMWCSLTLESLSQAAGCLNHESEGNRSDLANDQVWVERTDNVELADRNKTDSIQYKCDDIATLCVELTTDFVVDPYSTETCLCSPVP